MTHAHGLHLVIVSSWAACGPSGRGWGAAQEISLLRKKVQRLELKAYGRRLPLQADGNAPADEGPAKRGGTSARVAAGARALRTMQARVAALERNMLAAEVIGA